MPWRSKYCNMAIAKIVFADGSGFNIYPPHIPKIINGGLTVLYMDTSQWTVLSKAQTQQSNPKQARQT
jgi:hypothetical protein